jgi:SAM-dependent methyltransferase
MENVTARRTTMRLLDVVRRTPPAAPWAEGDNIPWHEPGFSERMLREHLAQSHDAASRRAAKVDPHVAWIHRTLLGGGPASVLDLGCGPGLYTSRLAALGHACTGIDWSPASIRHARAEARARSLSCRYVEADLREADFGRGHGLALLLYGELNVFSPDDAHALLAKAHAALRPGGTLLLEPHTADAVRAPADEPATWTAAASGLFSPRPHLLLLEHHWHEVERARTTRYFVVDAGSGAVTRHAQSLQAYGDGEYDRLLREAGFAGIRRFPSLTGDDAGVEPGLFVLVAERDEPRPRSGGLAPAPRPC